MNASPAMNDTINALLAVHGSSLRRVFFYSIGKAYFILNTN